MTGKGEKQKGDETQLQGKDVCVCGCTRARSRASPSRLGSKKGGSRSGQGASSHRGSPVTPPCSRGVVRPGPTLAANAPRSCQLGPFWPPPLSLHPGARALTPERV